MGSQNGFDHHSQLGNASRQLRIDQRKSGLPEGEEDSAREAAPARNRGRKGPARRFALDLLNQVG